MPTHRTAKAAAPHYQVVDMARGLAIVLMIGYHFAFDLDYFKVIRVNFATDSFWLGFRTLIVTHFLLVVGVSLHLATRHGINRSRYLRRLGLLTACATLVSVGSLLLFPQSWIFFGVLHFILLASIVGPAFVRFFVTNLITGLCLAVAGLLLTHPFFDQPAMQWFGLMTHKPVTEDYVPMLPWFGVVLIGMFLGRWIYGSGMPPQAAGKAYRNPAARLLAFGGRHSLLIYMTHQPLLLGTLYLIFG